MSSQNLQLLTPKCLFIKQGLFSKSSLGLTPSPPEKTQFMNGPLYDIILIATCTQEGKKKFFQLSSHVSVTLSPLHEGRSSFINSPCKRVGQIFQNKNFLMLSGCKLKTSCYRFHLRGHSTTTWTEFCHFLTPPLLRGQVLYPERGQKYKISEWPGFQVWKFLHPKG